MIRKSVMGSCGLMGLNACLAEAAEEAGRKTGGGGWIAVVVVLLVSGAVLLALRRSRGNRPGTHTPPQPVRVEPAPVAPSAEEEARTLGEITEACDRLGKLSNDMLKLYGGKDGVQRLQMMVKSIPQRPVKSVEEQLLETRIRQLAAAWREYKGIQSRFADPAYDRPLADPGLEEARKARLRMLREPHENQAVYDALEQQAR